MTRLEQMTVMRSDGKSWRDIGLWFGVSRARAHQIVSGYASLNGSGSHPAGWYAIVKERILDRDGNQCQECFSRDNLLVHHKDGDNRNNLEDNLLTLCRGCHTRHHIEGSGQMVACQSCSVMVKKRDRHNGKRYGGPFCEEHWLVEMKRRYDECNPSFVCEVCGSAFTVRQSQIKRRRKDGLGMPRFCSNPCKIYGFKNGGYLYKGSLGGNRRLARDIAAAFPDISHATIGRWLRISRERVRQILGNKGER